jgi:hypothetical protein
MWGGREPTELACTTNGECAAPAAARMLDPAGPAVGLISRFIGRNGSQFRSQI